MFSYIGISTHAQLKGYEYGMTFDLDVNIIDNLWATPGMTIMMVEWLLDSDCIKFWTGPKLFVIHMIGAWLKSIRIGIQPPKSLFRVKQLDSKLLIIR